MVVFESPTGKTEWIEDKKIVKMTQVGKNTGDSLKKCLDTGLDALIKNKAYKWMSDNREMSVHAQEDYDWINNDWTPRAIKSGWKKWALIQPKTALSAISEKKFVDFFASHGIEVKIFEAPEDGLTWLQNV
ncbi:hypothetical protein [Leptospira sarikeiensis]|uniref:STAS/SEC14 domain-containing protein n=1 Tax=Leptospira sarikeiensis TaxID=2484943 RepID=A0A4R9KCI1_9LEPT|nr:hypothetical protein [Leptospira sarikeiensis]TGL62831.1 hypothetical protein EHQ64_07935 [Leptospira sarikeiensis]